jgi:hypothetical protein
VEDSDPEHPWDTECVDFGMQENIRLLAVIIPPFENLLDHRGRLGTTVHVAQNQLHPTGLPTFLAVNPGVSGRRRLGWFRGAPVPYRGGL